MHTKKNLTSTLLSKLLHLFPYLSSGMLQAVHLPLDYLSKSQQLAQSFNYSFLLSDHLGCSQLTPILSPVVCKHQNPATFPLPSWDYFFFILLFKEKKPQAIFLRLAKYSYVSVSCKKELERKHTNSRLGQIHTNVTVNVQNIMCHCFSPPAPNKLLKTHFIHRITVLAVYLINMTTQRTQDFFQFPSFAFSHFGQKEQKVTTVFYFFCQYAIIYMS